MREPVEFLSESLLQQRAAEAWRGLRISRAEPATVEVLKKNQKEKRTIYRLVGVGRNGEPVIAKRCRLETGLIERTIYEQVLPQLPVTSLHYYGFVEEDETFCWLFLEDAGREKFSPLIEEHRALVAQWLGRMHTGSVHVVTTIRLPDRGPTYYLELLRSTRLAIVRNLTNPGLRTEDLAVLKSIVSQCDVLESSWQHLAACCQGFPSTVVHGDFRRKNVFVRTDDRAGTRLFPIDWEMSGWGVPAADLAPSRSRYAGQHLDLTTYWSVVRESWPSVDMSAIQQLVRVGIVFRKLAAMNWASIGLESESSRPAENEMRYFTVELAEIMEDSLWEK